MTLIETHRPDQHEDLGESVYIIPIISEELGSNEKHHTTRIPSFEHRGRLSSSSLASNFLNESVFVLTERLSEKVVGSYRELIRKFTRTRSQSEPRMQSRRNPSKSQANHGPYSPTCPVSSKTRCIHGSEKQE